MRDILGLDPNRFFYYARKVRRLLYDDRQVTRVYTDAYGFDVSHHLHPVLWLSLSMLPPDAPSGHHGMILPRLRSLSWSITTGLSAWFLPQLVTPSLKELTINFGLITRQEDIHYSYILSETFQTL